MVKHQKWGKIRIMNFELRSTGIRVWLSTTQGLPVCVHDQQTAQNFGVDRHLQSVSCQYAIYLSMCRPHIVQIYYMWTYVDPKGLLWSIWSGNHPGQGLLSCAAGRGVAESCLAESLGSAKFIKGLGQLQQKFEEWNWMEFNQWWNSVSDWFPTIEKSEIEMPWMLTTGSCIG